MPLPPPATVSILLVDDKPENLIVLEELLDQPDRQLLRATTGNDALRLMLKHDITLVLLDVEMPVMDGYEVAQVMRSADRTRLVPIIFVTAGDRSAERTFKGYEAGAVDFLYKPIDAHTLRSKVAIFIDLHRKTRALEAVNAELERTSALLREKVADLESVHQTLSHDLRAPLRSIRGFSQILAETAGGSLVPEAEDALSRVLRAGERMDQMIDDLYRLLRISASDATTASVDLARVLDDVVENLRADLAQAGASVTRGELPVVRANAVLVAQILQNLIANAIKFRGDAPAIVHVSVVDRAEAWEVAVRDNGVGIAPADRERVFKLFERLTTAAPGTGVGLALCQRAVGKLGGSIWIDPRSGPGATFCFTIPHPRGAGAG